MKKRIIVTGCAGFIGYSFCQRLLTEGYVVIGIDNLNDYYNVNLKKDRLSLLKSCPDFKFYKIDICDLESLSSMFEEQEITRRDRIVHFAAQVGVRYSLKNPHSYIMNNLVGFHNLLYLAGYVKCEHLIFASSSSVYGGNTKLPFSVHDNVDHPISLYAATKKSNELLAHAYSYTHNLPITGLRFFTVYGPWGRPDMSYYIFTKAILAGEPLPVFNNGDMYRDFTYIDDIVEGVFRLLYHNPSPNPEWNSESPDPASSWVPFRIYNIGNHQSIKLLDFIHIIEESLGRKAKLDFQPMPVGDVKATFADIGDISAAVGFKPATSIEDGIPKFIKWYLDYNN